MKEKKICDCSSNELPNMGGGGGGVEISNSAPVSAKAGSLWSDTDANKLYRRNDDGTAWKEVFSQGNSVPIDADAVMLTASTTESDYTGTLPTAVTGSANQAGYTGSDATGSAVTMADSSCRSTLEAGHPLVGTTVTKLKVYGAWSAGSYGFANSHYGISCCKGSGNTGPSFGSFNSLFSSSGASWQEKVLSSDWLVEAGDGIGCKYSASAGGTWGKIYRHSNVEDTEKTGTNSSTSPCSATTNDTSDLSIQYYVDYAPTGIITAAGGYFKSQDLSNPYVRVDMGATKNIGGVLLKNTSDTNATTVTVDVSADGTNFTTVRTILVSNLTDDSNSYIRFNIQATRYMRVRVSDTDDTKVLGIKKFYPLVATDAEVADTHGHLSISPTDTNLDNDGT